jgi:Kdo2-lipid IVA lauroyltransferase/acyltransferase
MYYIAYVFFKTISLLPFWALHGISNFFYFLIYHVVGYRKQLVMENLNQAFPEKTVAEKKKIMKAFYLNFCDTWMESIKMLSLPVEELDRRIEYNYDVLDAVKASGRSSQLCCGHCFNWEWGNLHVGLHCPVPFLGVYMPLTNKAMNRLFLKFRDNGKTVLIPAPEMARHMMEWRNKQYCLALVADQSASKPDRAYWVKFFGKLTPIVHGPEKGARSNNLPVVFIEFLKVKRGYYKFTIEMLEENPADLKEGELTLKYIRRLEENIRQQPEIYLWSHRRYKRAFTEEYRHLVVED